MSFRKPIILVADDDNKWLYRLGYFFQKKGYGTELTRFSEEALKKIKEDENRRMKGLVLDWLFKKVRGGGVQSTSPETIINHIVLNRPDVAIIVVSEAPVDESWNPEADPKVAIKLYDDILKKLDKYSDFITIKVFLKPKLDDDSSEWQKMYRYLQKEMKKKKVTETEAKQPDYKLFFKLGFPEEALKDYWGRVKQHSRQEKPLAEIVKNIFKEKYYSVGEVSHEEAEQYRKNTISYLFDQATEKKILVESRGRISSELLLKDTSFAIIEFLARKHARDEDACITVEEFQKLEAKIKTKKRTRSHDSDKLLKQRFRRDISKLRKEIEAYIKGVTISPIQAYRASPAFPIENTVYLMKDSS